MINPNRDYGESISQTIMAIIFWLFISELLLFAFKSTSLFDIMKSIVIIGFMIGFIRIIYLSLILLILKIKKIRGEHKPMEIQENKKIPQSTKICIAVIILLLIVMCVGGYYLYDYAYEEGKAVYAGDYDYGYNKGFSDGYGRGYDTAQDLHKDNIQLSKTITRAF